MSHKPAYDFPELLHNESGKEQFLLTQFTEMSEQWRHLDSRVENTINLYLASITIIATVSIATFEQGMNFFFSRPIPIIFASTVFFLLGFFVARRITSAAISRARCLFSMNLVRTYFQQSYLGVGKYLNVYRDTAEPLSNSSDSNKMKEEDSQLRPSWHDGIVWTIYVLNALALAFAFYQISSTLLPTSTFVRIFDPLPDSWSRALTSEINTIVIPLLTLLAFLIPLGLQAKNYRNRKGKYGSFR